MSPILTPWSVVVLAIAGGLNQEQARLVEYLLAENKVLKEQLKGRRRLRSTDGQSCFLSANAKALGRAALKKLDTFSAPTAVADERLWLGSLFPTPLPALTGAFALSAARSARDRRCPSTQSLPPESDHSRIPG